jgi:hypothetical protein
MSNKDDDLIFLDWKILSEDSKERVWYQEIPNSEKIITFKQKIVKRRAL